MVTQVNKPREEEGCVLNFVSLNVRGLRDINKRAKIMFKFKKKLRASYFYKKPILK
jgi:hypothetical protein